MPRIIYNLSMQFLARTYLIKSCFNARVSNYIEIVNLALIRPL